MGIGYDMHCSAPNRPRGRIFNFTGGNPYNFQVSSALQAYWNGNPVQFNLPNELVVQTLSIETQSTTLSNSYSDVYSNSASNTDDDWSILFGLIDFDINIQDSKTHFELDNMHMLNTQYAVQLFNLSISSSNLRNAFTPQFRQDMLTATQYSYSIAPDPYMQFLDKYGTHYVGSATFGGSISINSFFQATNTSDIENFVFNLHIDLAGLVGFDVGFSFYESHQTYKRQAISNYVVSGGIPDQYNLNGIVAAESAQDITNTLNSIANWKQTIFLNPAPIAFGTQRVSNLFSTPSVRNDMDTAIVCYFNPSCYSAYLASSLPAAY